MSFAAALRKHASTHPQQPAPRIAVTVVKRLRQSWGDPALLVKNESGRQSLIADVVADAGSGFPAGTVAEQVFSAGTRDLVARLSHCTDAPAVS